MIYYNRTSCMNILSLLVHEKGGSTVKIDLSYMLALSNLQSSPCPWLAAIQALSPVEFYWK